MSKVKQIHLQDYVSNLNDALDSGPFAMRRMLNGQLPMVDIAHILESFPPRECQVLWRLINPRYRVILLII